MANYDNYSDGSTSHANRRELQQKYEEVNQNIGQGYASVVMNVSRVLVADEEAPVAANRIVKGTNRISEAREKREVIEREASREDHGVDLHKHGHRKRNQGKGFVEGVWMEDRAKSLRGFTGKLE